MERIRLMVLRNFWRLPYVLVSVLWMGRKNSTTDETKQYALLRRICGYANRAGRITLTTTGQENLPKENGYILFPNHQGLYDVLAILPSHERPLRVVMKQEAERNFFLRLFLRMFHGQAIDREDVRQSMQVIRKMTEEVQEGANYLIFAEGTRSRMQNQMLEMKGGSFKSATRAKCPIVPVAIVDSYQAFDTHSTAPIEVKISYLPPLYYEEYQHMKTVEIAREVRSRIQARIAELEE